MQHNLIERMLVTTVIAASTATVSCTRNEAQSKANDTQAESATLIAQVGIEPGPVQHTEAPAAVLIQQAGDVQVRRLGEETFSPAEKEQGLFLGDQVRTGEAAAATLLFPDDSTAEIAEVSIASIGSRTASADPASSAAVLSGVARFSVSPRAPGEGPFLVFTPAGLVATKGTVFGVGVAADGAARVGVESGEVEVAGAAALDAPAPLQTENAASLSADGKLEAPSAWPQDDWGSWRDAADAKLDVSASAAQHAEAMTKLSAELQATHAALAQLGARAAAFELQAAQKASSHDAEGYARELPEGELAIEASFLAGLRLEYLTHAYVAHAALARELALRHPETASWAELAPRASADALWPKRWDVTASAYLEPLRVQYYIHDRRGRAHAHWVGVTVPAFYASVTPPALPPAKLTATLAFKTFTPPEVKFTASARPVWIAAPKADWRVHAKAKVAPPRGKVAFWVRPEAPKAKAIFGAKAHATLAPTFAVRAPSARVRLSTPWSASFGHAVEVAPPNLHAAARARAHFSGGAQESVELPGKSPHLALNESAHMNVHAKAELKGRSAKAEAATKSKAKAEAKLSGTTSAVRVKVKAPAVKPPKVKAEGKASAHFKLGT